MRFLTCLIILFSLNGFAHEHGNDHDHDHRGCKGHNCSSTEDSVVKQILDQFHEALSNGDHSHSFKESLLKITTIQGLKDWIRAFNLKRTFQNAYQFYRSNNMNPVTKEHLANLVFIFPLSHSLEMLFGPVMSGLALSQGWPASVTGILGITGAVISIPGVDPLCILIYMTYPIKAVQSTISFVRRGTFSILGFVSKYSGLNYMYQKMLPKIQMYFRGKDDISVSLNQWGHIEGLEFGPLICADIWKD